MNPFIQDQTQCDPLYCAVRDKLELKDIKEHVSDLWRRYHLFAEPQFLDEFSRHFQQRYWELYLGAQLITADLSLQKSSGKGPDFDLKLPSGLRFYIEATVVTAGTVDQVPLPPQGDKEEDAPYPPSELFLRITRAIENKLEQRKKQIGRGTLDSSRPYILAVNVGDIPGIFVDENPPTLSHVCLGFGGITYSTDSVHVSPFPHAYRKKHPNDPISTQIFKDPQYSWISGMFLSDVNPFYLPRRDHIQFLHNPLADAKVPVGWFPYGSEWQVLDQQLVRHKKV